MVLEVLIVSQVLMGFGTLAKQTAVFLLLLHDPCPLYS